MPATSVWLARIESAMNRTIAESSAAGAAAARLRGTSIDIDVDRIARIRAAVIADRLLLMSVAPPTAAADSNAAAATRPDAVIGGSLLTLLRTALNPATPQAHAGLAVSGDAEIAAGYRALFRLATPDFEEQIARILGDMPARKLSSFVATARGYLRRTRHTLGENITEYLQEESRDLVSRTEVDEFLHGVDEVRETADRVAARLNHLEQRLKGSA